ncbi:TetR/AcrR family transcriptional regulator [Streptomyces sp. WG7]|uniref:TetR/AcrR family transcriptional regulator n=1 Tax=Streptomyces sp. WG7 TaxID=3417650 RepID=UPI003CEE24DC
MATRTDAPTRREQILREAARLFAERGFHGVGVDEIGAAVGISGPGLYRHFAGKDAMLAELLVGISDSLLTGAKRRLAEAEGVSGSGAGPGAGSGAGARAGSGAGVGGGVGSGAGAGPEAVLDSLIEGHIDFALDDRPLITLHDRELDRLRDTDRKLVRQLQRQYVELWVGVLREVYPAVAEPAARSAVHSVFGLLNSTPHLGRSGSLPGRAVTAALLHRMARGAFAAVGEG